MPTKHYKEIVEFLEQHGFTYDRTNSKHVDFYTHPSCHEIPVTTGIAEFTVRRLIRNVQKRLGETTDLDRRKRSPENVKARQAFERERLARDIAQHEEEIADLLRQRDRRMDGLGRLLTDSQLSAIEALVESKERELRKWQSLMTEIPTPSAHAGRTHAQHRS